MLIMRVLRRPLNQRAYSESPLEDLFQSRARTCHKAAAAAAASARGCFEGVVDDRSRWPDDFQRFQ